MNLKTKRHIKLSMVINRQRQYLCKAQLCPGCCIPFFSQIFDGMGSLASNFQSLRPLSSAEAQRGFSYGENPLIET